MGVKALGYYNMPSMFLTLSNSPQSRSVRTHWQQVCVPWRRLAFFRQDKSERPHGLWVRERGMSGGRQPQRKEETVREGWGLMTLEQLFSSGSLSVPSPFISSIVVLTRGASLKLIPWHQAAASEAPLPLMTPYPSPESCESCPGSSWCAELSAWLRGSGTSTPSSVWPGQRESKKRRGQRHKKRVGQWYSDSERRLRSMWVQELLDFWKFWVLTETLVSIPFLCLVYHFTAVNIHGADVTTSS